MRQYSPTRQQAKILQHLASNPLATNEEIAVALGVATNTVRAHITAVGRTAGLDAPTTLQRVALVLLALGQHPDVQISE